MDDILVWQELGEFGTSTITIPCRKVSIERTANNFDHIGEKDEPSIDVNLLDNEREIDAGDEDYIMLYYDGDLKHDKCKKEILSLNCNFCIWYYSDNIIREILKSFSKKTNGQVLTDSALGNIIKQVDIDFPRCEVFINSKKITKIEFFNFCNRFSKYMHPIMWNLQYLLLMISTQASFYYTYAIINNLYSEPENGIHIVSTTEYMKGHSGDSWKNSAFINIVENSNSVEILFKKIFTQLDINHEKILRQFDTTMVFTIHLAKNRTGYYCQCKIGIIYCN